MRNQYSAENRALFLLWARGMVGWQWASQESMDDVRQLVVLAALAGEKIDVAVPKALGLRKLRGVPAGQDDERGRWVPIDPTVWRGEIDEEAVGNDQRLLPLRDARGSLTRGIANDEGIGLRAAQKRLKKARERGQQGDLFGGEV